MKIALVCIAKNEDHYVGEWVNYHLKLGFNKIFIYENDWESNIENDNVVKIKINEPRQQIPAYNSFIKNYKNEYDWVAFLDVDEFLVLKKHKNIEEFITEYGKYESIGINWVLFGDNHLNKSDDYSLINRFTMRQNSINPHIKSIVNLRHSKFMWVHNHDGYWVDTNHKQFYKTPFNHDGPIDIAQINHYFCKTKDEFIEKVNRDRADNGGIRDLKDFDDHNFNEVEDLFAYNFYNNL